VEARKVRQFAYLTLYLQPRVHCFAFQRQHAGDALMHPAQGLPGHEALQALHAEGELAQGQYGAGGRYDGRFHGQRQGWGVRSIRRSTGRKVESRTDSVVTRFFGHSRMGLRIAEQFTCFYFLLFRAASRA